MPTLPELQRDFMQAVLAESCAPLLGEIVAGDIAPMQRIAIYANNAEVNFIESLRLSFPAIRRLVGDAYFTQCAREYRGTHPSRSGDLQHVGEAFPVYWADRHGHDEFRYLADIARLEWLYQEALTGADYAPFDLERLAAIAPAQYDGLRFRLHPCARLFASDYPALAIWEANVGSAAEPEIIDLRRGGDQLLVIRSPRGVEIRRFGGGDYAFLEQLAAGEAFAAAIAAAQLHDANFDAAACLQTFVRGRVIVDFSLANARSKDR